MNKITEKAQAVLDAAAAGLHTREDIAEHLGVSVPAVNGSMTALKRNNFIKVDAEGIISLTRTGKSATSDTATAAPVGGHRAGTKMAEAAKLFDKLYSKGRQDVLDAFQRQVGLTKAGASTYYQTLRTQAGISASNSGSRTKAVSKSRR